MARNLFAGHMMEYRPGTDDENILRNVMVNNGYHFGNLIGKTVVDIGGHIGAAAILCAARGAKVYSFEPCEESFKLLKKNIKLNEANVTPWQYAVGNPGESTIFRYADKPACNSFFIDPTITSSSYEKVRSITLGNALIIAGLDSCDILKLDCEGSELFILRELVSGLHHKVADIRAEIHFDMEGLGPKLREVIESIRTLYFEKKVNEYEFAWSHR